MLKILTYNSSTQEQIYNLLSSRSQLDLSEVNSSVAKIIEKVRDKKDDALIEFTSSYDNVDLDKQQLKVSDTEISDAVNMLDKELAETIKRACKNIILYHERQRENSWFDFASEGVLLGQLIRPLEKVGVYVPGGTAPLISSVLMNVIPAKVAGVKRVVIATPPQKDGRIDPGMLFAAKLAGVDEIYRVGGAQAIAAMAYGTETVPSVDKIFGPGNIYVSTAKRMVFGRCDIDMFAGPSEIAIIADSTAIPSYIAADMMSQAEHDALAAAILVTDSMDIAKKTIDEINIQIEQLSRKEIIKKSLKDYGLVVVTEDLSQAFNIVNKIAPEHLELCIREPYENLSLVKNAGAIFLGNYSSEPVGDYFAGPSHVIPTGGTARFFSPLNVLDFVKRSSIISYSKGALMNAGDDVIRFAEAEGLTAHANAVKVRLSGSGDVD